MGTRARYTEEAVQQSRDALLKRNAPREGVKVTPVDPFIFKCGLPRPVIRPYGGGEEEGISFDPLLKLTHF